MMRKWQSISTPVSQSYEIESTAAVPAGQKVTSQQVIHEHVLLYSWTTLCAPALTKF